MCGAVKRVYAHEAIKDDLIEALSAIARSARVDEGTVESTQFGPVLSIISFTNEDDAVAQANDSQYTPSASVWSGDPILAGKLAAEVDTGQVPISIHRGATEPETHEKIARHPGTTVLCSVRTRVGAGAAA